MKLEKASGAVSRYKLSRSHKLSWYRELYYVQWWVSGFKVWDWSRYTAQSQAKSMTNNLTLAVSVLAFRCQFKPITGSFVSLISYPQSKSCRSINSRYSYRGMSGHSERKFSFFTLCIHRRAENGKLICSQKLSFLNLKL
jgi:hypothetical protein